LDVEVPGVCRPVSLSEGLVQDDLCLPPASAPIDIPAACGCRSQAVNGAGDIFLGDFPMSPSLRLALGSPFPSFADADGLVAPQARTMGLPHHSLGPSWPCALVCQ
jgi:hypothetical protein